MSLLPTFYWKLTDVFGDEISPVPSLLGPLNLLVNPLYMSPSADLPQIAVKRLTKIKKSNREESRWVKFD